MTFSVSQVYDNRDGCSLAVWSYMVHYEAGYVNHWFMWVLPRYTHLGPVSLRLMTSQFKDIVTHTQKLETVKCIFCDVWVQNFVWNFKGHLWNFTQNFEPYITKYAFYEVLKISRLTISYSYDILSLSETSPWACVYDAAWCLTVSICDVLKPQD